MDDDFFLLVDQSENMWDTELWINNLCKIANV